MLVKIFVRRCTGEVFVPQVKTWPGGVGVGVEPLLVRITGCTGAPA